jgi:hypothetical protein
VDSKHFSLLKQRVTLSVPGLLNLHVVRATLEKFDIRVHAGKMKFNTQNKE